MQSEKDEILFLNFLKGEWVDANEICRILGISFCEAFSLYDFSREARWAPYPAEGQIITCKFKIKGIVL
jgi:hypothetical protein